MWHVPPDEDFHLLPTTEQKQLCKHTKGTCKMLLANKERNTKKNQEDIENRDHMEPTRINRDDKIEWTRIIEK